jgi:penicillin V acylase-like amidase (Ntn superfamily)
MTTNALTRALAAIMTLGLAAQSPALACTRILYTGSDALVITGRSMDWMDDMRSDMWAFPAGMSRDGAAGPNSPKWVSKYGSLIVSGYDVGTADGMNEAGLVANLLYLAESDYAKPDPGKPPLSISLWAQYALDNFATVAEAVAALSKEPFVIVTGLLPNGKGAQLHLSLSDAVGDSAIFEYLDGKLVIHHGKAFTVMTNSPSYDQQLALASYWKDLDYTFLPGTHRAADRFARASWMLNGLPKQADPAIISAVPGRSYPFQALASVLGAVRGVSVPLGVSTPGQPNIASTLWRTVADQRNKVYAFDSATSPNTFWVPLADLDLKPGAPAKKLELAGGKVYSGNAAKFFVDAKPFAFLPVQVP